MRQAWYNFPSSNSQQVCAYKTILMHKFGQILLGVHTLLHLNLLALSYSILYHIIAHKTIELQFTCQCKLHSCTTCFVNLLYSHTDNVTVQYLLLYYSILPVYHKINQKQCFTRSQRSVKCNIYTYAHVEFVTLRSYLGGCFGPSRTTCYLI